MDSIESIIDLKLKALHSDVSDIKSSLTVLTEAITKLALIEERQATSNAALDRAFTSIGDLANRVKSIELILPELKVTSNHSSLWVDRFVWAAMSGGIVYLVDFARFT